MAYVKREDGKIVSFCRWDNIGEEIEIDSEELIQFFEELNNG